MQSGPARVRAGLLDPGIRRDDETFVKQYSEACDENRDPILSVISNEFRSCHRILEIGSGTGQHAVYFARQLSQLDWYTSDISDNHLSINAWITEAGLANVHAPVELDVTGNNWPDNHYDGLFSANTTHIISWPAVEAMFSGIGKVLEPNGVFCLYGPFNYDGQFTSASNAHFDQWLKQRDPESSIRDFEALDTLATANGLAFKSDHEMPVNNRLLVWTKI